MVTRDIVERRNCETSELDISCEEALLSPITQYSSREAQFFIYEAKVTSKIMVDYRQGLLRL